MRQLSEDEYWKLVFPSSTSGSLAKQAPTCAGSRPFEDPLLENLTPVGGFPIQVKNDAIMYGGGGNRLKVAWLKTHEGENGTAGGALALVRALEDYAEVYGVGVFRGDAERTRLGLERMGHGLAVTATDDRCSGVAAKQACDSVMHVFLPFRGELLPIAEVGLQRVRFTEGTEPGVSGKVRYELVTTPTFEEGRMRLMEQVSASDETGRKLRRAEVERLLTIQDGKVKESTESLWSRMIGDKGGDSEPAKTPAADKAEKPAAVSAPATPDTANKPAKPESGRDSGSTGAGSSERIREDL